MKEKNCSKLTDGLSTFFVSLTNGKLGKKFYSPYFKQMIEVVKYVDDNHWSFKLENGEVYAAKTPLSYFEGHDFTRDNPKRAVKQDMSKGQFVDGTDKTNDKIEEILLKHSPYVFFGNAVKTELFGETVKHLTTLINQERKEAVEECIKLAGIHTEHNGNYCDTGEDMDWACRSKCVEMAIKRMLEYLSQLNKEEE